MTNDKTLAQPQNYGQRFTSEVMKQFGNEVGTVELSQYQKKLAQHLFIAIDTQLKFLESRRQDRDAKGFPIVWTNINMAKLALDAMHRIELGLDALIPNHIHAIPYYNKTLKKYDLDLRIGYVGKDFYRRKMALDEPEDIIYELVYSTDKFKPVKKTKDNPVESYDFEIMNPFERGEVIGGFGYVVYKEPERNKLVIVSKADFDKSRKIAKSDDFWKNHTREMQFKTLVHRVTSTLNVDPEKINASFMAVEMGDSEISAEREIQEGMAGAEVIDIEAVEKEKADPMEDPQPDPGSKEEPPPPTKEEDKGGPEF